MLADAVLIGLAAVYVWYVVAVSDLLSFANGAREKLRPLIGCPWCLGFWLTGAVSVAVGYDPLTHLGAAAVCGVVGGFVS